MEANAIYPTIVSRLLLPLAGRVYNGEFVGLLKTWQMSQFWPVERLAEYRRKRLLELLAHAKNRVPFYRDHFETEGLLLEDFANMEDLSPLPVLSKDDYRELGIHRFLSDDSDRRGRIRESTSGTSGTPFEFYIDRMVVASKMARLIRENDWAGWRPGDRYLRLWGPHRESLGKKLFYSGLMRRVQVPAFSIQSDFVRIAQMFDRYKPRIVEAYTSAAVDLATQCEMLGRRLPSPESIIVSAETLTDTHRNFIESILGGKVFNRYGSREFGNMAHECGEGTLHLNSESFIVEEEEHPNIEGGKRILITFLDNYSMPFIRYRIGDLGRIGSGQCPCGRSLPSLERLEGRETDFFKLPGEQSLSYLYFNYFFEQFGGIVAQYQVEQVEPNMLEVRIVPGKDFDSGALRDISQNLRQQFNERPKFSVDVVGHLEREPSGKLKVYRPLTSARYEHQDG